jgi:hypothetical protein
VRSWGTDRVYRLGSVSRGLSGCTPIAGTDVCFDATATAATANQAGYTTDPNVTTLIDPYGWFALDAGRSGGVVRTAAAGAAAAGGGRWLQKNGVMLGVSLALAAIVFGAVKR